MYKGPIIAGVARVADPRVSCDIIFNSYSRGAISLFVIVLNSLASAGVREVAGSNKMIPMAFVVFNSQKSFFVMEHHQRLPHIKAVNEW